MSPEVDDPFDGDATGGGDGGGGDADSPAVGPSDVLEALLETEPNPELERLPGEEQTSYFLRGTLKFASGLLGTQMDIPGITDTALHDYIRAFVAGQDSDEDTPGDVARGDL